MSFFHSSQSRATGKYLACACQLILTGIRIHRSKRMLILLLVSTGAIAVILILQPMGGVGVVMLPLHRKTSGHHNKTMDKKKMYIQTQNRSHHVRLSLPFLVASIVIAFVIPYQLASSPRGCVNLSSTISSQVAGSICSVTNVVSPALASAASLLELLTLHHCETDQEASTRIEGSQDKIPTSSNNVWFGATQHQLGTDSSNSHGGSVRNTKQCFDDALQTQTCSQTHGSFYRVDVHLALRNSSFNNIDREENHVEDDNFITPTGQNLLVDIANVDSRFLWDQELLARAMVQLITESKLTLLSYHCLCLHCQPDMGESCVGLLSQGKVSLRAWPQKGVISLGTLYALSTAFRARIGLPPLKYIFRWCILLFTYSYTLSSVCNRFICIASLQSCTLFV